MNEPTYIQRLRAIRDQIGEELRQKSWQDWEKQARQKAMQDPKLARLIEQAENSEHAGAHVSQQSS